VGVGVVGACAGAAGVGAEGVGAGAVGVGAGVAASVGDGAGVCVGAVVVCVDGARKLTFIPRLVASKMNSTRLMV
jgi:hypothetical protein